jgi:hypothetical protein
VIFKSILMLYMANPRQKSSSNFLQYIIIKISLGFTNEFIKSLSPEVNMLVRFWLGWAFVWFRRNRDNFTCRWLTTASTERDGLSLPGNWIWYTVWCDDRRAERYEMSRSEQFGADNEVNVRRWNNLDGWTRYRTRQ